MIKSQLINKITENSKMNRREIQIKREHLKRLKKEKVSFLVRKYLPQILKRKQKSLVLLIRLNLEMELEKQIIGMNKILLKIRIQLLQNYLITREDNLGLE